MASKASLKAYCVLGMCLWLGDQVRRKNPNLINNAILLKQEANNAANLWGDKLTKKQVQRIQRKIKTVFDGPEDLVRVGSMLLGALEDIKQSVQPKKKEGLDKVIETLLWIVQYYDGGKEWDIYEQSVLALNRFNKMIGDL